MNVSEEVKEKIRRIEEVIGEDPGNRGITPLVRESRGSLLAAALDLQAASSVGIVTGFYILACNAPETDGPPGAIAIARALLAMRKKVSIITDTWSERMMTAIQAAAFPQYLDNEGPSATLMPVTVYPDQESESNSSAFAKEWSEKIIRDHKMDHLLSIERVGPALDGKCHNMRGLDITAYTAPLHSLFDSAEALSMRTTGIGDGGNELGMGKLRESVAKHVPNGEVIGCTTATNNLIVTGVSNWGGYALAASLYLLEQQKNSAESLAKDMLPARDEESRLLDVILKAGAVDGVLRASVRSVDGMEFDKYAEYLDRINQIALTDQKC